LGATIFTDIQVTEQRDKVDAFLGLLADIPSNGVILGHHRCIFKVKMDVIWFTTAFLLLQT
jgi:hypothetical protein